MYVSILITMTVLAYVLRNSNPICNKKTASKCGFIKQFSLEKTSRISESFFFGLYMYIHGEGGHC